VEARARTHFDARGIVVGGTGRPSIPFLGGALHYWRVEPRWWEPCVRALADLGLRLVETHVPWSVHETRDGRYDWTGARDLGRFLDVVADVGLGAVLRPGPQCNAQLTGFGYPDRILRDEAMLARTAHGGPVWMPAPPRAFPAPSYASAAFRAEVARWYEEVARIVGPRLAPDGPVVALGVDHEAQMSFRLGAYDHDYHPEAITWWHEAGGEGPPPKAWDPDDAAHCVRWVRFKDAYTARALGELAGALDRAGLGDVARFHNLPPGEPLWFDLPGVARAIGGPAGIDVYASRRDLATVRRRALYLVGSADPLPIVPECGVGFFPWLPPIHAPGSDDQRDVTLALLAAGVRGLSFHMAVERERWYDAAISPHGEPGPAARWIRPLIAALDEVRWTSLRRATPVALVVSRADARFGLASSLLDPVTPVVAEALGLGPAGAAELGRDDAAIAHRRWLAAVQRALDLVQIPYVLVDESCGAERLAGFRAVIAPTFDRIDRGLLDALHHLADRTHVLVLGPGTPTRDELGRPLERALPKRIGLMRAGSLDDVAGLADDLAAAVQPPDAWTLARGRDVDCAAFADDTGNVRAVFLFNHSARAHDTEVVTPGAVTARDPFSGQTLRDGIALAIPAHAARMLVIE